MMPNDVPQEILDLADHFAQALLWSSTDSDGEPLDDSYDMADIVDESMGMIIYVCSVFWSKNEHLIRHKVDRAGHDLCLTMNGHGCGFWDGGWPKEAGESMTKDCRALGEIHLLEEIDGGLLTYWSRPL